MQTLDLKKLDNRNPIIATSPSESTSAKYAFIDTKKAISAFEKAGWHPVTMCVTRAWALNRVGFQRHMIRFRNTKAKLSVGDIIPELIYENSHDGSCTYKIHGGLYRLKCENGLVIAEIPSFESVKVRHYGLISDRVEDANKYMMKSLSWLSHRIRELKTLDMTRDKQNSYAWDALNLRYKSNSDVLKRIDYQELLTPLRKEDNANDLWTTYNKVQEHLIKGIYQIMRPQNDEVLVNAKPLTNIKELIRVNSELWELTDTYSRN